MIRKIKVLVIDDSAFIRKAVTDTLSLSEEVEVIATASDGEKGLDDVLRLRPDVVLLDVQMSPKDGLETLQEIMAECPTSVIMLSAYRREGAWEAVKALELGAVDFVKKPLGPISPNITGIAHELVEKIKTAASLKPHRLRSHEQQVSQYPRDLYQERSRNTIGKLVAIGASAGGPKALSDIFCAMPKDMSAGILVVQHMPPFFTKMLAERLNAHSEISIKEAEDGEAIQTDVAYIAPGGFHLKLVEKIEESKRIAVVTLDQGPKIYGVRPAVDFMMKSAAAIFKKDCVGVILTGMGRDGTEGIIDIKRHQGKTIAEDPQSCVVPSMPASAIRSGCVDKIVPLKDIPQAIVSMIEEIEKAPFS